MRQNCVLEPNIGRMRSHRCRRQRHRHRHRRRSIKFRFAITRLSTADILRQSDMNAQQSSKTKKKITEAKQLQVNT